MENPQNVQVTITGNGMATASLVLGIIGLVIGIIPFIGWFALPLWILAIIFGIIGAKKQVKKGLAISGIILGSFTVAYKFGFWILIALGSM